MTPSEFKFFREPDTDLVFEVHKKFESLTGERFVLAELTRTADIVLFGPGGTRVVKLTEGAIISFPDDTEVLPG